MAEQRPLVLVFEDLHWADDELLEGVVRRGIVAEFTGNIPTVEVRQPKIDKTERPPIAARTCSSDC
jgi:hypothetical protein